MAVYQENKKIEHFFKVMMALKKRPGMYISPVNLDSIRNFICGYNCVNLFEGKEVSSLAEMLQSFYNWVAEKEQTTLHPSRGWVEIINQNSNSDDEAVNKYFKYLDLYFKQISVEND